MSSITWTLLPLVMARGVLFLLVFIHLVLPFTSVNQHPELTIKIASIVLGSLFLWVGLRSGAQPFKYLSAGLALLVVVYIVSHLTGASPFTEGIVPKAVFAALLLAGVVASSARFARNDA